MASIAYIRALETAYKAAKTEASSLLKDGGYDNVYWQKTALEVEALHGIVYAARARWEDDACDYLDQIDDEVWERTCGSQGRDEFATLALDAGQSIEEAWSEALAHAENL